MAAPTEILDARPVIPVNQNSPWKAAEAKRDEFANEIEAVLESMAIRAQVSRSQPGEYPVRLTMRAWKPEASLDDTTLTQRDLLSIEIDVNPYLTHPLLYEININADRKRFAKNVWKLDKEEVAKLSQYVLGEGEKPKVLKTDYTALLTKKNKLIESARPSGFTGPQVLGLLAIGSLFAFELLPVLVPLGVVIAGIALFWSRRRPKRYSVVNRPDTSPRLLFLVDSWHTSIPDVGSQFPVLFERLESAMSMLDNSIRMSRENHQYETPYGLEERGRLTFTKGQAVVHLHIYPFASDAFVGWDGFMNWSKWSETVPVSTSVRDGKLIEHRSLTKAFHIPNEFDLVEFNALTELIHRRIVMEVKAFVKEREIEAELDFTVIRGDRSRALSEGKDAQETIALRKNSRSK